MEQEEKTALFWDLAQPLLVSGIAERGTMMGYPCLRIKGKFFASLEKNTGNLIVKLPAERVNALVFNGDAKSFAPNGRVFREWALFDQPDETVWGALLDEAQAFVDDAA